MINDYDKGRNSKRGVKEHRYRGDYCTGNSRGPHGGSKGLTCKGEQCISPGIRHIRGKDQSKEDRQKHH